MSLAVEVPDSRPDRDPELEAFERGRRQAHVDAELESHEKRLAAINGSIEKHARNADALRGSISELKTSLMSLPRRWRRGGLLRRVVRSS
jgi:septal ring factor EnvC (AmiA/AmiB activator)